MPHESKPAKDELAVLACVPQLAAYFRRARMEMTDGLRDTFDRHGLTARHGALLTQLSPDQALSVSELARRLGVSLSTGSELVSDLSRAGLVRRTEDPENRRRTLVSLADDQRPAVRSFIDTRAEPLLRAMAGLSPEDRRGFLVGLAAWVEQIQAPAATSQR